MNPEVVEYIRWASHLSVIIPLVVYTPRLMKSPIQNHIVAGLLVLSGSTDTISLYTGSAVLFNAYQVLMFLLTTWFFYELVYRKKSELFALISIGVYISVLIFSALKYGLNANYTNLWVTGSAIIFIHTVVYIFTVPRMIIERYFDVNLLSNMIFNASMFAFFIVALMIFFLYGPVSQIKDLNTVKEFWAFHNMFNIIKNLGFALAFYYTGKRSIYMTFEQLERRTKLEEERDNKI